MPLYLQLAAVLKRRIACGEWPPGRQIPTLEELTQQFGVARVTARQAVGTLEQEGLIWRKQGKGTFVADGVSSQRWLTLESDWSSLVRIIEGTETRLLDAMETVGRPRLQPTEGTPAPAYQYLRRLHSRDGAPYAVIDIYLDRRVYRRAPKVFRTKMVLPVLETLSGIHIAGAHQTLTIGTADIETAELLEVPISAPVAEVRRVVTDQADTIIYVSEIIYRGDFIKLDISVKKDAP